MLIYLADNRSTVINLQCVGDMHIEKSRYGWEIKCEMSSVSGFGTTTCSLGCFACKENAVSKILEILKCYGERTKSLLFIKENSNRTTENMSKDKIKFLKKKGVL